MRASFVIEQLEGSKEWSAMRKRQEAHKKNTERKGESDECVAELFMSFPLLSFALRKGSFGTVVSSRHTCNSSIDCIYINLSFSSLFSSFFLLPRKQSSHHSAPSAHHSQHEISPHMGCARQMQHHKGQGCGPDSAPWPSQRACLHACRHSGHSQGHHPRTN